MSGVFKSPGPGTGPGLYQHQQQKKQQTQVAAEDRAARRRARRGGRALLSESRLNPEEGVSTLGSQGL
jgi:hypothetical protein